MPDSAARLRTMLVGALERTDPAERTAYLDDACGDDTALRERVEDRLAAHEGARRLSDPDADASDRTALRLDETRETGVDLGSETQLISEPSMGDVQPDGAAPTIVDLVQVTRPGAFVPGQVLAGRFTLLEVLGEGGMGTVYRAEQSRPVKRQVALKLIRIGMDSRPVLARFEVERQALAMMDHPNIARVYDGGVTEAGQPFFAMELVRGVQITDYCDQKHLHVRNRLELFVAVCQAVQHAHQKGIIHRDLKPSNVMVTEVDGRPTPKVIDFGVAKATEFDLTDQSFGDTGAIVGTPSYMSPEQADPSSMDVDTRTDVYALGAILYELLAGSPPMEAASLKRVALLEMLRMVREVDPPKPSTKVSVADALPSIAACRGIEPAHLKQSLQGDLDWIVMKALEKDRTRRYETANGFAADVMRYLASEPVSAAPPSRVYRMQKFVRKHRAGVIAASLVLLALLAGVTGTTLGLFEARRQERIAQQLATREAKARGEADERAEQLAREDYINRVNRAYREVQDDNVALAEDLLHGCDPERRGWEWHFVERLCNLERLVLDLGHASVNAMAYSPDGRWTVVGYGTSTNFQGESTIEVRDVATGQRLKILPGTKGTVFDVAVSADGKTVAAGCSAGLVMVWDVTTGKAVWARSDPGLDSMCVTFSPDGKSLAVGYGFYSRNSAGHVRVWDVATGKEIKSFPGPLGGVNKVAFHPDGKRLAVAGSELVEVWDLEKVRKIRDLKGHKRWIYCLAYSPDGKWLASGGWDRTVKLSDSETGVEALTIFAHKGFVLGLAFSPDGRTLATASEDRSTRLWEIPTGRQLAAFHGHTDFVQAVAFRPDGREVGTGSMDGSVRFWDLVTSRPVVVEHVGWVERIAVRRDGMRFLSETGLHGGKDVVPTKGWNPFTGEIDGALARIRFDGLPAEFVPGSGYLHRAATSPDGKLVAQNRSVRLGELAGQGGASRSKDYSFSSVFVRDAASGQVRHTLTAHTAEVVSLAFSPDSRRLATASFDRTIKLWDTQTGQVVFTLLGHTGGVLSLMFSPDGRQIASGGIDATARVWDATPLPARVIAEHDLRYRNKVEMLTRMKETLDDTQRAEILAVGGQWGRAAESFARAVAKQPEQLPLRYQLIDAMLHSEDPSGVGPACEDILKQFGSVTDPLQAAGVAGLCRLGPQAISDLRKREAVHEMVMAPDDFARVRILAKYEQWDLVSQGLSRLVESIPDNLETRVWQLLSLIETGDLPKYRAASADFLSRSRAGLDPNVVNNVTRAWLCTYAPDAVPN